jgi:hypothetical protein
MLFDQWDWLYVGNLQLRGVAGKRQVEGVCGARGLCAWDWQAAVG